MILFYVFIQLVSYLGYFHVEPIVEQQKLGLSSAQRNSIMPANGAGIKTKADPRGPLMPPKPLPLNSSPRPSHSAGIHLVHMAMSLGWQ